MVKTQDLLLIGGATAGGYLVYNSFFTIGEDEALRQVEAEANKASQNGQERNDTAADPDTTEEELDNSINEAQETREEVYNETDVPEPDGTSVQKFLEIIDSEEDVVTAKRLKLMELNGEIMRGRMEKISNVASKAQNTTTIYNLWENRVQVGLTVMGVLAGLGLMTVAVGATFATGGFAIAPAMSAFGAGLGTVFLSIRNAKNQNLLRVEKLTEEEENMIEFSQRRIELENLVANGTQGDNLPRIDGSGEDAMVITDAISAYKESDSRPGRTLLPITLTDVFTITQYNDVIAYNVQELLRPLRAVNTLTEEEYELDVAWAKENPGLTGLLIYGYISRAVDFNSEVVGDQTMSTLIGGFNQRVPQDVAFAFDSKQADEVSEQLVEALGT